jgi:hypothetical protein
VITGGLAELRRWLDSGGGWELVSADADRVVVALVTCTGGEVVDVLESADAELRLFVSSDAPA